MKKNISLLFVLLLSTVFSVQAQFNKKLTFNLSAGLINPIGGVGPFGNDIDPDGVPYTFSNFTPGFQFNAGMQYNLKSYLSFGLNIRTIYLGEWEDPLPSDGPSRDIENFPSTFNVADFDDYFLSNSLGVNIQYKFLSNKGISPYLWGEASGNVISFATEPRQVLLEGVDRVSIIRFNARQVDSIIRLGLLAGAGVDFKLSESVKIFVQGDYNVILVNDQVDLRRDSRFFGFALGTRLSIFKSKSFIE